MRGSNWLFVVVSTVALGASACGGGAGSSGSAGSGAGPAGAATGAGPGSGGSFASCDTMDHTGDGTYYDADGTGNCSFDATNDLMVAAMNDADYAGASACGACVHVIGPSGEVTVRIVDRCPGCEQGDVDLSPQAFSKLADLSLGRVTIHWRYVPCDVTGPIVYHFKEGSNPWWTAVQIRNARHRIEKLEVMKGGAYVDVGRVDYNYFVDDEGMGPGPYAFRVTDVEGGVVEDEGIPFLEAGDSMGAQQFPACGE